MTQLRLLKINIQPIFVTDDGEHLAEQAGQIITVGPADWEQFATTFMDEVERVRREYADQTTEEG